MIFCLYYSSQLESSMHLEVRKVWGLENVSNMIAIKVGGEAQTVSGDLLLYSQKTICEL